MKIFTIIQARLNSTRLPKKVLLPFRDDKNVLEFLVDRLKKVSPIIATVDNANEIIKIAKENNLKYFVGDENNVLERFYKCAINFGAKPGDIIVRICSDSPFLTSNIVENMIEEYQKCNCDYIVNPVTCGTPKGLNVEVFSFECLKKAYLNCDNEFCKEHVTPWIKENCKIKEISAKYEFDNELTLDTKEDYERLKKVNL